MKFNKLKLTLDSQQLEQAEALLIENGFTGMIIDDPADAADILEHPDIYRYDYINDEIRENLTRRPVITLYFACDEEGDASLRLAEELLAGYETEVTDAGDDSEWLYKWQEYFKPVKAGSRIVVKPGWEDYEASEGELVIEMDPGMAFGSGLHETTSMCIKALEKILGACPDGMKVMDVGCGTGILAMAAAMLGAGECLAIDIDPEAVRVSEENIERNGLTGRITVRYGDLTEGVDYKADIIAANLMADLVIRLTPAALRHLSSGGWYITSGILDIKEEAVTQAIRNAGFIIEEVLADGEWRAVIARLYQ